MKRKAIALISTILLAINPLAAVEILAQAGIENRYFNQSTDDYDSNNAPSLFFEMSVYEQWNDGEDLFAFTPFFRWDKEDSERTHFDIKELSWIHIGENWELRSGFRIETWGVTEAINLVDIINQRDTIDQIDGDEKLGQPMLNLSWVSDWGTFDIYGLTGFREKRFPGAQGRPRLPLLVNTEQAEFESDAGDQRLDFAFRWQHMWDKWQIALSQFSGTAREPVLLLATDSLDLDNFVASGQLQADEDPRLVPFYPVIDQTGLEALYLTGNWNYKLELIRQSGVGKSFYALDAGVEYNHYGIWGSNIDIGWIFEYLYDSRDNAQSSVYQDDLYFASRIALNNQASGEALFSLTYDPASEEKIIGLESSWRHGEHIKIQVDGFIIDAGKPISAEAFINAGLSDKPLSRPTALYARQNFIQAAIIYHF